MIFLSFFFIVATGDNGFLIIIVLTIGKERPLFFK